MVGRRLVGLPRLVVASAREALLALTAGLGPAPARAAGRSCARPGRSPASRATANPPLRTRSTPHEPGSLGGRREGGDVGRSGVRRREGQAGDEGRAVGGLPGQRPVADDERGLAVARGEVLDPAADARRRHQDRGGRRHAQVTRAPSAQRSSAVSVELVAPVPQGEVEGHGGAAQHDVRVVGRRLAHRGRGTLRHGHRPPRVGVVGQDRDRRRVVGPQARPRPRHEAGEQLVDAVERRRRGRSRCRRRVDSGRAPPTARRRRGWSSRGTGAAPRTAWRAARRRGRRTPRGRPARPRSWRSAARRRRGATGPGRPTSSPSRSTESSSISSPRTTRGRPAVHEALVGDQAAYVPVGRGRDGRPEPRGRGVGRERVQRVADPVEMTAQLEGLLHARSVAARPRGRASEISGRPALSCRRARRARPCRRRSG